MNVKMNRKVLQVALNAGCKTVSELSDFLKACAYTKHKIVGLS